MKGLLGHYCICQDEGHDPLPHIALRKWLKEESKKETNHWRERDTCRKVLKKLEEST